jgi:hypothetical protein
MVLDTLRDRPAEIARKFGLHYYREAYKQGMSVSQLLEREDPSHEYPEGSDERSVDAFERLLHAEGIITQPQPELGLRASTWEEATNSPERRALLHEFGARVWRRTRRLPVAQQRAIFLSTDNVIGGLVTPYADDTAMRATNLMPPIPLAAIVARETGIEGDAYRTLYVTDALGTDAYRMKRVAQGTEIPTTTLVTGEHLLRIGKFGRALRSTYEQLRRERLDRIAFIIQRMAVQAEADKVADALGVIVSGDGNANTAAAVLALTALDGAAVAGTLTLKGWLVFKNRFTNAYRADTLLAQEAAMMQLELLPVNTVNGTPLAMLPQGAFGGVRPISDTFGGVIRYGITADAPALKLVAFDSAQTVEMVTEIGGEVSEVEKFITNQTQVLTLTEVVGFGIVDPQAAKVLNINA